MSNYQVTVNGKTKMVKLLRKDGSALRFAIDGVSYDVDIASGAPTIRVGSVAPVIAAPAVPASGSKTPNAGEIVAPMPGTISAIKVDVGDTVAHGDTLLVMEAMKMENNILSSSAGKVEEILVSQGDQVSNGQVLLKLMPE